jgi:hypothetical protein
MQIYVTMPYKNDVLFVLYLQLCVEELMSDLLYMGVFAQTGVFLLCCLRPVSCVPNVASFTGLSIFLTAPLVLSDVYLHTQLYTKLFNQLCIMYYDNYMSLLTEYKCPDSYSKCGNGLECIRTAYFCDGRKHCKDGSDEDIGRCLGN